MPRNKLNLSQPAVRQLWLHVTSGATLMILGIAEDHAQCAILNEVGTASPLQLDVPLDKFRFYGNRGLRLVGSRKHTLPKVHEVRGLYNPRLVNLGAV